MGLLTSKDTVERAMSKKVHSVAEHESIAGVTKLMSKHNIGAVIVMRGEDPYGIVTERDIAIGLGDRGAKILDEKAGDMASKPLVTVVPETAMLDAFGIMLEHKTRRLPVVRDGKLLGIVTERDLFKWVENVSSSKGVPVSLSSVILAGSILAALVAHSIV